MREWNQCVYCGRFIAYQDFESGDAVSRVQIVPSYSMSGEVEPDEQQDAWHVSCASTGQER